MKLNHHKFLILSCSLGLIITCVLLGGMALVSQAANRETSASTAPREDRFTRGLREYDALKESLLVVDEKAVVNRLNRLLDGLEKIAGGMETQLSVLKRRRALALGQIPGNARAAYREAYNKAAGRIAEAFPYSDIPAVIAAEALVLYVEAARENFSYEEWSAGSLAALNREDAEKAEHYADRITAPDLIPAALELYALSGALGDPRRAMTIPRGEDILFRAAAVSAKASSESEKLVIDAALLRLLKGDVQGAGVYIRSLTEAAEAGLRSSLSRQAAIFTAEYLYDFGEPLRAAEYFSRFKDEESLARQADAQWLAGRAAGARQLWVLLSSPEGRAADSRIQGRSLYNLASLASTKAQEAAYLERLLALDSRHEYGIIRYTRLLDAPRAIAILEESGLRETDTLVDLEWLRRKQNSWTVDRMVPETWLLLARHDDDERLYQWAAYYFELQRRYDEIALVLQHAKRKGMTGSWIPATEGLELIRLGRYSDGISLLRTIVPANAPVSSPGTAASNTGVAWQVPANIGRVLEAERSYTAALEYYEMAASTEVGKVDAARIQIRIARCMRALGRERESKRVLEYAYTLDPDNTSIRLELGRLDITS